MSLTCALGIITCSKGREILNDAKRDNWKALNFILYFYE